MNRLQDNWFTRLSATCVDLLQQLDRRQPAPVPIGIRRSASAGLNPDTTADSRRECFRGLSDLRGEYFRGDRFQGDRFRGFTLIELLVVIAIISVLMGIMIPTISYVGKSSNMRRAVNLVDNYSKYASRFALIHQRKFLDVDGTGARREYAGAAVLFTPGGNLELWRNVDKRPVVGMKRQWFEGSGNNYYTTKMDKSEDWWSAKTGDPATCTELAAKYPVYIKAADIPSEGLPGDIGAVGIAATAAGTILVAPPFAVRFNGNGNLEIGDNTNTDSAYKRSVYIDGNCDLVVDSAKTRSSVGYTPSTWTVEKYAWTGNSGLMTRERMALYSGMEKLPFERIETALGVVLYSKADFESEFGSDGLDHLNGTVGGTNVNDWLVQNGATVLFNRYAGGRKRED